MNQADIDAIFVEGTPLGRTTVHARALARDKELGRDSKGRPADSAVSAGLLLVDDQQETEKGAMGRPTTRLVPASWSLRVELPTTARGLDDGARGVLQAALVDYAKVWVQIHAAGPWYLPDPTRLNHGADPVSSPTQPTPVPGVPFAPAFPVGDTP
jgi:hypothetical protein